MTQQRQQQDKKVAWEEYSLDKDNNFDDDEDDDMFDDNESSGPTLIMGGSSKQIPKELASPFKYFKCHKCHSNFNITMNMLFEVEKVDGVEVIIPLTRYSCIIAVAKLFSDVDVKESVTEVLLHGEGIK